MWKSRWTREWVWIHSWVGVQSVHKTLSCLVSTEEPSKPRDKSTEEQDAWKLPTHLSLAQEFYFYFNLDIVFSSLLCGPLWFRKLAYKFVSSLKEVSNFFLGKFLVTSITATMKYSFFSCLSHIKKTMKAHLRQGGYCEQHPKYC